MGLERPSASLDSPLHKPNSLSSLKITPTNHYNMASMEETVNEAPPLVSRSRSSSSSSFDFDESFFYQNYVPLSNLPTPPLGHSNASTRQQSPESFFPGEDLSPAFLGPAVHLTNLIPSSTSLTTPSIPLVQAILTRANPPVETIALAACILDSLNSRFALTWRQNCPLNTPAPPSPFHPGSRTQEQHIDCIHPELLILCALIVAVKFLDDSHWTTADHAADWGHGLWSCEQINFTQRCLLENISYRLLPLCEESIIADAVLDMERAARRSDPAIYDSARIWRGEEPFADSHTGRAVLGVGDQLTPAETPISPDMPDPKAILSLETKRAFSAPGTEPFPAYVEPAGAVMEF